MATYQAIPTELNIEITNGDELAMQVTFDKDLTDYSFQAFATIAITDDTELTVDATQRASGIIEIGLDYAQTYLIPPGTYSWYLFWQIGSTARRTVLAGTFTVRDK